MREQTSQEATLHTRARRQRQRSRWKAAAAQAKRARAEWLAQFPPQMREWIVKAFPAEMVGTPLLAVVLDRYGAEGVMQTPASAASIIATVRLLQENARSG